MTKAYLAGFIAGMNGKGWDSIPFENLYSVAASEWRQGYGDSEFVAKGNEEIALEEVGE